VLVGRSAPSEAASGALRDIEATGAAVRIMQADVSLPEDVRALVDRIKESMPPLRGVLHAAAVLDDRTLLELEPAHIASVFGPKVLGAWNLHEATRGIPLDFFVMYSSAATVLGSLGQGNYAAANAFLDALGHARGAEGLAGTSIQWGPFSEVGMAAAHEKRGGRLARRGLDSLSPAEGVEVLRRVLQRSRAEVAVMRLSVRQWLESYPQAAALPFWSEVRKGAARALQSASASVSFRAELEQLPAEQRSARMEKHVLEQLGRVVRTDASRLDRRGSFTALGVDSLMSLELRNRLEASLGLKLSSTLLFTYANPVSLAEHLVHLLLPPVAEPELSSASSIATSPSAVDTSPSAVAASPSAVETIEKAPDTARTGVAIPSPDDDLIAAFDASVQDLLKEK
jgi:acyl carrier protein